MNNRIKSLALLVNLGIYGVAFPLCAEETPESKKTAAEETMVVTAAEQNLQAPGVSTITADEIRKNPPARDVSEIIRTMPGVNLTGNTATGQRGNKRQIDIRGMGPENTLILIDGKPVTSRNSVRQGWRGERDTRGAFDESRRRPSIEMRRELVDVDAQLRELRRVVFYEGAQQSLVVAHAHRPARSRREEERVLPRPREHEPTADGGGSQDRVQDVGHVFKATTGVQIGGAAHGH